MYVETKSQSGSHVVFKGSEPSRQSETKNYGKNAVNAEENQMTNDRLLSEVARQEKYLRELPADFTFPLFNAKRALESQRRSGYRSTASAAREIVDNGLEAKATEVHVAFDKQDSQGRDVIASVAFIDNGSGMIPKMIQYALSWGGGTHFDDPDFIGKFGFGLPNASINQTKRVEVYSRTSATGPLMMSYLDAAEFSEHGVQAIPAAIQANLPAFVVRYLQRANLKFEQGTVVVWVNPDRLSYRTVSALKSQLIDDFGVTYRYLLKDFTLLVEGARVEKTDPLFLEPDGRLFVPPESGGSELRLERAIPVRYFRDAKTGERHLAKVEAAEEANDPSTEAFGNIYVKIARFPVGFADGKGPKRRKGQEDSLSDPQKRFEIRKSRRGMSFVRVGREIETLDAFPRSRRDIASGLGRWPLLQGYAYHYGIEVKFGPELDEVFGITNDKQTVRPSEDFWRVLTGEGIDAFLSRENRWQSEERLRLKTAKVVASDNPSAAEMAAQAADSALGRKPVVPEWQKPTASSNAEHEAEDRAKKTHGSIDDIRAALAAEAKVRPYRIEYVDDPRGPFYDPQWVGTQMVVRVNKQHPFFQTLYGSLLDLKGGKLAKEAVDLLLIALSKGEMTVDEEAAAEWYKMQREVSWSPFLATGMRTLSQTEMPAEEETEEAA